MIREKLDIWKGCFYVLILMAFFCNLIYGCASDGNESLDYAKDTSWIYSPINPEYEADVFFLGPTVASGENLFLDINNDKAVFSYKSSVNMEKGVFDDEANFFAPLYRQASISVYEMEEDKQGQYFDKAYNDVDAAFDYYIKELNNGRPFILAGYSQGAYMTERLLIEHATECENMICAYIIGWRVSDEILEEYPHMKMAKGEKDTGVIISYCSETPELESSYIVKENTNGINPLNWKTDGTVADRDENKGSCFTDGNGNVVAEIPALCGAYIDETRGTLKITDVTPEEYPASIPFLENGDYHVYEYSFFYRNLEENVQTRINQYIHPI